MEVRVAQLKGEPTNARAPSETLKVELHRWMSLIMKPIEDARILGEKVAKGEIVATLALKPVASSSDGRTDPSGLPFPRGHP